LALTEWPDKQPRHGSHLHARNTRKVLQKFAPHKAVRTLQLLLEKNAPLDALYTLAMQFSWPEMEITTAPPWMPPHWGEMLRSFYEASRLRDWWQHEDAIWEKGIAEASKVFRDDGFPAFLRPFLGPAADNLHFFPNVSYPTNLGVGVQRGDDYYCIAPPPLAWGDSPPWPFDEDLAYMYRTVMAVYTRLLLRQHAAEVKAASQKPIPVNEEFRVKHPEWEAQFTSLFVAGTVAIYLEDHGHDKDAKAHVLMEQKAHGMAMLPGVIHVLRRYLSEHENGRYQTIVDFLPVFPNQLRVAKRIVNL